MSPADLVLRADLLLDGSGRPARPGDVAVRGDRIAAVGAAGALDAPRIERVPALAPGFIDIHAHGDFEPLVYPRAESKALQGVTTEVSGNCGSSPFPAEGAFRERLREKAGRYGVPLDWTDAAGYFDRLDRRGAGINRCFLTGHNTLRAAVVGYADRPASADETDAMRRRLADALRQGSVGFSTGLLYPPGCYAPPEEVRALAAGAAEADALYTTHMRNEGGGLLEALEETCGVARDTGVRTQVSHLKASGEANWHKIDDVEAFLRRETAGSRIACDRYPYTAAATDLDAILPAWAWEGGVEAEIARLRDPATRERLLAALRERPARYWPGVMIGSVQTDASRPFEGKTVAQLAEALGLPPPEAVLELLLRERTRVEALFFGMSEENMQRILSWPFVMVGSDSTARDFDGRVREGKPHPRGFGTFPRVLAELVRRARVLTLEEAVRKMTAFPAARLGLTDRGRIAAGCAADLVAFDPDAVEDRAAYADPWHPPEGIHMVLVNGTIAVDHGTHTGALAGRVLRRPA